MGHRRLVLVSIVLAPVLAVSSLGTAKAEELPDVSAVDAVAAVAPDVGLVELEAEADGTAVAEVAGGSVEIPVDGSGAVVFESDTGIVVEISLPAEASDAELEVAADGSAVFESAGDVDVVAQATDGGVRIQTVISDADAPESFTYEIGGATPVLNDDGSVSLVDSSGDLDSGAGLIEQPWAFDADGVEVPTRFVVDGDTVIQEVHHSAGDYAYPIVADPAYWWGYQWGLSSANANRLAARLSQGASVSAIIAAFCAGTVVGIKCAAVYGVAAGIVALGSGQIYACNARGRGININRAWAGGIVTCSSR